MNKNIVIIGINYYPEDSAIGLYTTQKAEYLVEHGFDVTVITGFPYYPQWKITEDYKSKSYLFNETINGVKVLRCKQYVPKDPTFFNRVLHLISFTFGNFINLFKVSKPDIVVAIIPFTSSVLLGWLLKLRYKSKLWVHIQDFEFDAAIDSGLLSGNKKIVINTLLWIEKKVLKKADIISTISLGMMNKLQQKTNVKTYYLSNWIDVSIFKTDTTKKHQYLSSKNFKILYSGNIGAKQDWVFFFEFLKGLQKLSNIEVLVVGEGAEKENLLRTLKDFKFVKHFNLVPYKELPLLLTSTDLHILFQKNDVIDTVMPSKLIGMMASAKPSIVTGNINSEVAKIYKESNGGYFLDGSSIEEVIMLVLTLQKDDLLCKKLGTNANSYVINRFSKEKVLSSFVKHLKLL